MEPTPKKKTNVLLIVALVLAVPVLFGGCCLVFFGAGAISGFTRYMARAKTAEATTNLSAIATRMESYRVEFARYPASLPPTPPGPPGSAKRLWPADADQGWTQLGFQPLDPLYYSYEVETAPDGESFVARARGDLDGDGVTSLFERHSGSSEVIRENETE